jgi:uroporphyrinogen-III synthase
MLLRPEPGLSASADRAGALGIEVICCPLFRVEPTRWGVPDPAGFDALLLTSANAARHAGPGLERLMQLPVHAVGRSTAEAARIAGLRVESIGDSNVEALLTRLPKNLRLLHLAGEDHKETAGLRIDRRIVYRAAAVPDPGLPPLDGLVVAVHSPRAGARLAELATDRRGTRIAAISEAAAEACGTGWEKVEIAAKPDDNSLLALAAMLCQT